MTRRFSDFLVEASLSQRKLRCEQPTSFARSIVDAALLPCEKSDASDGVCRPLSSLLFPNQPFCLPWKLDEINCSPRMHWIAPFEKDTDDADQLRANAGLKLQ